MPVVLLAIAVIIVGGIVVVAQGRGGELVEFAADRPPFDPEIQTAADVALLRPPPALWGYSVQATDEALYRIAQTVSERDVEIATLRRQLGELRSQAAARTAPPAAPAPWPAALRPDVVQSRSGGSASSGRSASSASSASLPGPPGAAGSEPAADPGSPPAARSDGGDGP